MRKVDNMVAVEDAVRDGVDLLSMPKVSLHDHLDGAIRPSTVVALSKQLDLPLPVADATEMANWFTTQARGTLEQFLSTFALITPLLQQPAMLTRVAREYVIDIAADGVVYGEVRWAPEQHVNSAQTLVEACEAVHQGLSEGMEEARSLGHYIDVREIYCAMRQANAAVEIAECAVARRDLGVVGFDFAGPEQGFPVSRHRRAIEVLHDALFPLTIHAGEAAGLDSIVDALAVGQPCRIGHGTHLLDDFQRNDFGLLTAGRVAAWVRDREITLECCPSSNLMTDAMDEYGTSLVDHPINVFVEAGMRVSINTDDRTQTGATLTGECIRLVDDAQWHPDMVKKCQIDAAKGAFLCLSERHALIKQLTVSPIAKNV